MVALSKHGTALYSYHPVIRNWMMKLFGVRNRFGAFRRKNESILNTWANHLIVIFCFSIPLLIDVRRSSLFIILLLFLLRGGFKHNVVRALRDPVIRAFSLYFFVHLVWLIGTDDSSSAKKVFHDASFLLIPLVFYTFIDARYIPRMLGAFFFGMLASEVISYGILMEIVPPMLHDGGQGTPANPTPVWHHIHYGFMLAISLTLTAQRLFSSNNTYLARGLMIFFFVTASGNIFITAGRTGYLLYAILLFTLVLLIFRKQLLWAFLATCISVTLSFSIAYMASPTFKARINQSMQSVEKVVSEGNYNSSIGIRLAILLHGKDSLARNWLMGAGTGDHTQMIIEDIQKNDPELSSVISSLQHPHNEYLSALLQFGIIGLLVFLNILYQLFRYKPGGKSSRDTLKIIGVAVLVFSMIDVFVLALGAMFTALTLATLNLANFPNMAVYKKMDGRQLLLYASIVIVFLLISYLGSIL